MGQEDYSNVAICNEITAGLRGEAKSVRPLAERFSKVSCVLDPDGGLYGRGSAAIAGPGPRLSAFQSGEGLAIATRFAGSAGPLYPTRASYLFYSRGDHVFLHHDVINAHITLLIGLEGDLQPLIMYPRLGAIQPQDLDVLNAITSADYADANAHLVRHFGERAAHYRVEVPENMATLIRGRRVAHARFAQKAPATVCAACYAFLKPPAEWLSRR